MIECEAYLTDAELRLETPPSLLGTSHPQRGEGQVTPKVQDCVSFIFNLNFKVNIIMRLDVNLVGAY